MNIPSIIENYLKGLQSYCYPYRGMEIRGTERVEELSAQNINLPDVFTVLNIRSEDSNLPTTTIPPLEQWIDGRKSKKMPSPLRQLLFGDPGSGKTTLFNYLAYLYATNDEKSCETIAELQRKSTPLWEEDGILLKERQLPILIICREIPDYNASDFYEYVLQSMNFFSKSIIGRDMNEAEKAEALAFLNQEIARNNVLLLVDGLDEIPTEKLNDFLHQLLLFLTEKTGCDSLISSRKGNREVLELLNQKEGCGQQLYNQKPLYISPIFQNELKMEFAERWTRAVFQFDPSRREIVLQNFEKVLNRTSSAKMIDNILYLTIVLVLCSTNGGVPTNICELINQVIETQLSWKNHQNYSIKDVFMQLACVAYKMSNRIDRPLSVKEDELVELLMTARKDIYRFLEKDVSFDTDSVRSFIRDYLVEGTGILVGKHGSFSANDEYQFRHNQFQSYLTMCAISRDYFAKKDIVEDKFSLMAYYLFSKNDLLRQVVIFGVLQKGRLRDIIVDSLIKGAGEHVAFLSVLLELIAVYELRFDFEEQETIMKCIPEHIHKMGTEESKEFCRDPQIRDFLYQLVSSDLPKYGWIAKELMEVYMDNKGNHKITSLIDTNFSRLLIWGLNWSEMPEDLAISFIKQNTILSLESSSFYTLKNILQITGDISHIESYYKQLTEVSFENGQSDFFSPCSVLLSLIQQARPGEGFDARIFAVDLINSGTPKTQLLGISLLYQLCMFVRMNVKDLLSFSFPKRTDSSWNQAKEIIIAGVLTDNGFRNLYRSLLCELSRAGFISYEAADWMTPEIFLKEISVIDNLEEVEIVDVGIKIVNLDIELLGSFPLKTESLFQSNYNLRAETVRLLKEVYYKKRNLMDGYIVSTWYRALLHLNLFSYEEAKEEFSYLVQSIYQKTLRIECPPIEIDTCKKLGKYFSVDVSFIMDAYPTPM